MSGEASDAVDAGLAKIARQFDGISITISAGPCQHAHLIRVAEGTCTPPGWWCPDCNRIWPEGERP